jgi:hypothetical protein
VQDQPVVCVAAKRLRDDPLQFGFDIVDRPAWSKARSITDPEYVCVDGEGFLAKRRVENNIGRLASDARQRLQLLASARHLCAMLVDQRLAEENDVLCLGVEQADGLDRISQSVFTEQPSARAF